MMPGPIADKVTADEPRRNTIHPQDPAVSIRNAPALAGVLVLMV